VMLIFNAVPNNIDTVISDGTIMRKDEAWVGVAGDWPALRREVQGRPTRLMDVAKNMLREDYEGEVKSLYPLLHESKLS
jgi:hypothetical protein